MHFLNMDPPMYNVPFLVFEPTHNNAPSFLNSPIYILSFVAIIVCLLSLLSKMVDTAEFFKLEIGQELYALLATEHVQGSTKPIQLTRHSLTPTIYLQIKFVQNKICCNTPDATRQLWICCSGILIACLVLFRARMRDFFY